MSLASSPVPRWRETNMAYPVSGGTSEAALPRLRTLPVSGALYADVEARGPTAAPFSVAVSADSYRSHMLRTHGNPAARSPHDEAPGAWLPTGGVSSFVSRRALTPSNLLELVDALLGNTSLASLDLDHCGLDAHSVPALTTLLAQHPTLTSISLAGNRFGMHPDSPELSSLFQALASRPCLPHLMHLGLANNQLPPRSLELFSQHFLRCASSIQSVDLRENDIGLRGGWALVDALRARNLDALSPVCELRLDCESRPEHATADAMALGRLPQPNVSHTASAQAIKPNYFDRLQTLLEEGRRERDARLLREEERTRKREDGGERKEASPTKHSAVYSTPPHSSSARITPASSPSATAAASSEALSAPEFVSLNSYHASLGRMVSELNSERACRHACEVSLAASRAREQELSEQLAARAAELEEAREQLASNLLELERAVADKRALEDSVLAVKTREAGIVSSHTRLLTTLQQRSESDRAEHTRLKGQLRAALDGRESDRLMWARELRAAHELANEQVRAATQPRLATLDALERRLDAIRADRERPPPVVVATLLTPRSASPAATGSPTASPSSAASSPTSALPFSPTLQTLQPTTTTAAAPRSGLTRAPAPLPSTATSPILTLTPVPIAATHNSLNPTPIGLSLAPVPAPAPHAKHKLVLKQRDY